MGFLSDIVSGIGDVVTGNWGELAGDFMGIIDSGGDFLSENSGALSSAAAAQMALQGQRETNSNMKSMFDTNIGWQGQSQQNAFAHDREMATAQMGFQDYQSKTEYQRAQADLQAAGLNPILAAARGGNTSMGGSAPTSGGSGGSSIPQLGNKVAAGLSGAASAASIANMQAQNELLRSQSRNVDAQTLTEQNRPENIRRDTDLKVSSAKEHDWRVVQLREEADRLRDIIEAKGPQASADADRARAQLFRVEAELKALGIPEAKASAEMYKTPLGKKLPYIHEGERALNSAVGAASAAGNYQQRRRLNNYIIEGK